MNRDRVSLVKPGLFGNGAAADSRRGEFDIGNEILLTNEVSVDYVFIGDSITHMWELNAYFGIEGRYIVNRGIGGDVSSHVLRRFDADVIQLKPKYVVIKIGVNNFWALDDETVEGRKTKEEIIPGLISDIEEMVKKAISHGIIPIVCSILPTNMPELKQNHIRNTSIITVNVELEKIVNALGAIYVDYHSRMIVEDSVQLRNELADDGLHPHVKGYNIMAHTLRERLESRGIKI